MEEKKYRQHQERIIEIAKLIIARNDKQSYTIVAPIVPSGGKSWLPLLLAKEFPEFPLYWTVPRENLRHQAALTAINDFGFDLREASNEYDPLRGANGCVFSHQALHTAPDLWKQQMKRRPGILAGDEGHHFLKSRKTEKLRPLARAVDALDYKIRIIMTGTLENNNGDYLYGFEYKWDDEKAGYVPDVPKSADYWAIYSRIDARRDDAIVPMEFEHCDGESKWARGGEIKTAKLSCAPREDRWAALFSALRAKYADKLLDACCGHWLSYGIKLLVVCDSRESSRKRYEELSKKHRATFLAISGDEIDSSEQVKAFRKFPGRAILVTCMIAYEGLDVPAITHICLLTHIRSVPWILQALARAWRLYEGKYGSWCFCPDDQLMCKVIDLIRAEDTAAVTPPIGPPPPPPTERPRIYPIDSDMTDTRGSVLDGPIRTPDQSDLARLILQAGFDPDDERYAELFKGLAPEPSMGAFPETPKEREMRLRREIHSKCSRIDRMRQEPFKSALGRLLRLTNISTTVQTEDQLNRSLQIVNGWLEEEIRNASEVSVG